MILQVLLKLETTVSFHVCCWMLLEDEKAWKKDLTDFSGIACRLLLVPKALLSLGGRRCLEYKSISAQARTAESSLPS